MKNRYFYFILFILCISCQNIENKESHDENNPSKFLLNKDLLSEVSAYIQNRIYYDSISTEDFTCYIEFSQKDKFQKRIIPDTLLYISTLNCLDTIEGYQGVFIFKNDTVVIFDRDLIGINYYSLSFLNKIPYKKIKCRQEKIIPTKIFKIREAKIIEYL